MTESAGRGVGAQLFDARLAFCRQHGRAIVLNTREDMRAAVVYAERRVLSATIGSEGGAVHAVIDSILALLRLLPSTRRTQTSDMAYIVRAITEAEVEPPPWLPWCATRSGLTHVQSLPIPIPGCWKLPGSYSEHGGQFFCRHL